MAIKRATAETVSADQVDQSKRYQIGIRVRAESAQPNEDGTITIFVEGQRLDSQQQEFIRQMFPNTMDQVHHLLAKEALISAILD